MSHTPGPWTIKKCPCGHEWCGRWFTSNGFFHLGTGYLLDDAHLIAAAPDLLEALEALLAVYLNFESGVYQPVAGDKARAAIAKAKGEGGHATSLRRYHR